MNKKSVPKLHSIKWKKGVNAENVSIHPSYLNNELPIVDVLSGALNEDLESIAIVGRKKDGSYSVFSSSPDTAEAYFLLLRGIRFLDQNTD